MYQLCGTYTNDMVGSLHARGEVSRHQMKEKTISQLLEEVANEICDNYCKYPAEYNSKKEFEELLDTHCLNCPLSKLC